MEAPAGKFSWKSPVVNNVIGVIVVLVALNVAGGFLREEPTAEAPEVAATDVPKLLDPENPFEGSPAEKYADGMKGIVAPKAKAMGGLPAREVAAAYKDTTRLMAAAFLDEDTVLGGRPKAFAALLDPEQRKDFFKRLDAKKQTKDTRSWVVSIAPGKAELVGDVIKVHGTMKAKAATHSGWRGIDVATDYIVVYAVRAPSDPLSVTRLVVRFGNTTFHREGERPWLLETAGSSAAPVECSSLGADGFIHPDFGSPEEGTDPTGAPVDPYDQSEAIDEVGCQTVTRT